MALVGEAIFGHMIPKYAVNLVDAPNVKAVYGENLRKGVFGGSRFGKASRVKTNQTYYLLWKRLGCPSRKYEPAIDKGTFKSLVTVVF